MSLLCLLQGKKERATCQLVIVLTLSPVPMRTASGGKFKEIVKFTSLSVDLIRASNPLTITFSGPVINSEVVV